MYEEHFGFREPPFRITPDPRFLYRNACVEEAAAALAYGIERRKGFLSLVGEAGTGKTTLLRHVLNQLSGNVRTVLLLHPTVTFDEILEYILTELGIPVDGAKKLLLLQRLHEFLLEHTRAGGNVALLIDEAQDLDIGVLEELRLLSNLETGTEKILQIVLAGQPELEAKLADQSIRQLRQRIALHVRLRPLSADEVIAYVQTRLELAGATRTDIFAPEAVSRIAAVSLGIPRVVNVLCDACLVTTYATNSYQVTPTIVEEAWHDYSRLVGDIHGVAIPRPVALPDAEPSAPIATAPPPPPAPETTVIQPAAPVPVAEAVPATPSPPPVAPPVAAAPPPPPTPPPPPAADVAAAPEPVELVDLEPEPSDLRAPAWASSRRVTIGAVVALLALLALNFSIRSLVPTLDGTPTPETAVARMPVVSGDDDPLVTTASLPEAKALVHQFMLAYEARDPERLSRLFAADASENDHHGVGAIRDEYARTFDRLSDVSMSVPNISTEMNGERLTITGPLVITYRDAAGARTELRGTAHWEIARQGGIPRILRLRHDVSFGTS
jgi:general secretion pathway protein A